MGWVIALAVIALLGNLYLFSGYNVRGDVAEFIVAVAVIADILVIFGIFYAVFSKIQSNKQAKENKRIASITEKINNIITANTPSKIISVHNGTYVSIPEKFINKDVFLSISHFRKGFDENVRKCLEINDKLLNFLSCPNCKSVEEKLEYLEANINEIQSLKLQSNELVSKIERTKFSFPKGQNLQLTINQAMLLLLKIKKCECDNVDINKIVSKKKPIDISLFDYKDSIVTFKIDKNYYCMIEDSIVVFDKNGYFSTVLNISAFTIDVEKKTSNICLINGKSYSNHQYIDSDSKLLHQGRTNNTWVHTCVDGSPDLRYNYNPKVDKRIDTYEYGIITIGVANCSLRFFVSSQTAIKAFEELKNILSH